MKGKLRFFTGALLSVMMAVGIWCFWHPRTETFIQGWPASYWAKTLGDTTIDPNKTWTALGPEALPYFAKSLQKRNAPLQEAYLKLWPHLPSVLQKGFRPPVDDALI